MSDDDRGARTVVSLQRQVGWIDTDAAGRYHHSSVIRWVEDAEAELLESLGTLGIFGSVPRVHYEVDYLRPVYFRDIVETRMRIASVGTSSIRYEFVVRLVGDAGEAADAHQAVVARGVMIAVAIGADGASRGWTGDERERLLG